MKIAIIPSADLSYNSGSIIYAKKLFQYLHQNGHEAFLLGSKKPNDIPEEYMKYIIINQHLLEHPIIDDRKVENLEYNNSLTIVVNYLLKLVDEYEIDIIHAHYGSFTSFGAFIANGLTGIPYIISSFGRDINIGYTSDTRIKWLIEKSFLDASSIIVSDESIKQRLIKIFEKFDITNKIIEIPMPLDNLVLKFGNIVIKEDVPIIATINSCFSPEKGIATILEAFARVTKKIECKLLIAGQDDHPEKVHEKYLCELVKRLKIEKKVEFLGYLKRQDVGELLRKSTIFVDARLKGNFSSVLLEAMFLNATVIASDTQASQKIIKNDFNGYLFPIGDADGLEKLLLLCLSTSNSLMGIKENTKVWVSEHGAEFLEEECFQKVLNVYKAVKGS